MKKLIVCTLLFFSYTLFAATPAEVLGVRLDKNSGFSAQFTQQVISPDKEILSNGSGFVAVSRPNLFHWQTKLPDENLLVSDGKTLWFYDPFVEQVTASDLSTATAQTPFILIVHNDPKDWDKYQVTQKNNEFSLTAKDTSANLPTFVIDVLPDGVIKGFQLVEQDGQKSRFTFNHFKNTQPSAKLFRFSVPKGVDLDDQRAK